MTTLNVGALIDATATPDRPQQVQTQIEETWYQKKAREQGHLADAPIHINDKTRSNAVTFAPVEFTQAPDGHPLSGATDISGRPLSQDAAQNADPSTVLVVYNGMPMRLSAAESMGLVVRDTAGRVFDAERAQQLIAGKQQPSGQPAANTTTPAADPQGTAGTTEDTSPETIAKAPLFDDEANAELSLAWDALTASGFEPNAAMYDMFQNGATVDSEAIVAISRATGETPEHVVGWAQDVQQIAIDKVADVVAGYGYGPELLTAVYESSPGAVHQAQLSALASGSLAPLIKCVLEFLEQNPSARTQYAAK